MKKYIIIAIVFLISGVCFAFQGMGPGPGIGSFSGSEPSGVGDELILGANDEIMMNSGDEIILE